MLTELNAINIMLRAIGQAPVTSTALQHPHVIAAKESFDSINMEVQSMGWWFNEDTAIRLLPNGAGEIIVPGNTLNVDPTILNNRNAKVSNLVQRGTKLYDPVNNTFVIGEYVDVTVRLFLDFRDIPHVAQNYIAYYAGFEFQSDYIGDNTKLGILQTKVDKLYAQLRAQDIKNRNTNAQYSPTASRLLGGVSPMQRR